MAAAHPDLEAEQAYIDRAYECLEATRTAAKQLRNVVEVGQGGTLQARFERDVFWDTMVNRLAHLQLGDQALCFGRIDTAVEVPERNGHGHDGRRAQEHGNGNGNGNGSHPNGNGSNGTGNGHDPGTDASGAVGDSFYIGRIAVSDEQQEPIIVDWRAPVAEPFYRATGREPMGLVRRRHFATRGRTLLNIEDELFGDAAAVARRCEGGGRRGHRARRARSRRSRPPAPASSATSSPPSRASRTRSSARTCPACSSCRAAPARARRSWRSTGPRTSSTRTASRWRARASSSSDPTGCSSPTSTRCCRRSARPGSSWRCSPTSCPR